MAENKKPGNTLSTTEKKTNLLYKSKSCSACHLANLSYDQQLSLKTGTTIKLISKFCHIEPIIGAKNPTGYRNKAQAVFMKDKEIILSPEFTVPLTGTPYLLTTAGFKQQKQTRFSKLCACFLKALR